MAATKTEIDNVYASGAVERFASVCNYTFRNGFGAQERIEVVTAFSVDAKASMESFSSELRLILHRSINICWKVETGVEQGIRCRSTHAQQQRRRRKTQLMTPLTPALGPGTGFNPASARVSQLPV